MPDVAPTELGNYCVTRSINIPRLWRYGSREFASSIRARRTPYAAALLNTQLETDVSALFVTLSDQKRGASKQFAPGVTYTHLLIDLVTRQ